jgi:hypothetical protein
MKDLQKIQQQEEGKTKTKAQQGEAKVEPPRAVAVIAETHSKISRQTTPVEFAFTSIRSPFTRKNYLRILRQFFDYVGIAEDTIEEKGQAFLKKAKEEAEKNNNSYWAEDIILNT